MVISNPDDKFGQMIQKIAPGSRLLHSWMLQGGVSAQVTALEIERTTGQTQKLIVRQHGPVDLKHNPHIAADEFKLLQFLCSTGLSVPTPYYLDESGEIFPTPYIVLEYIEGRSEFPRSQVPDFISRFATQLAEIHQIAAPLALSFLPEQEKRQAENLGNRPLSLDISLDEGRIRDTLEAVWPLPQRNTSVLLHGDFWPGNILWKDGRLAAVIDWEDAALGDPLADLANSRLEILWAFGVAAMQSFTQQYQAISAIDFTNLSYWDLCAALRPVSQMSEWVGDEGREKVMRERHRWFITQAFARL